MLCISVQSISLLDETVKLLMNLITAAALTNVIIA